MDTTEETSKPPSWLELQRVIPLDEAGRIAGISRDGLRRHHADKIRHLSPRRVGMRLRDALAIANGGQDITTT